MSQSPPVRQLSILGIDTPFPPVDHAWGESDPIPGLLCVGADLSVSRLIDAYSHGIFPWYNKGEPILWWSPDPRMILKVADFKISHSFAKTIRRFRAERGSETRMDTVFPEVIARCANIDRPSQQGTWILPELQAAYIDLHAAGFAHSVETWVNDKLVGGLYFTQIGNAVFGESMFALQTDASKIALWQLVQWCTANGIEWIDCQQQTQHLASLGAAPIPRPIFIKLLRQVLESMTHAK